MYFKLEHNASDILIQENEKLSFPYTLKPEIQIIIEMRKKSDNSQIEKSHAICSAITIRKVNHKNEFIFKKLEENSYKEMDSFENPCSTYLINKVRYFVPDLSFFPNHFSEFIRQIYGELNFALKNTLRTLKWIYDIETEHVSIGVTNYYWSRDNQIWHNLPLSRFLTDFSFHSYIEFSNEKKELLLQQLNKRHFEPEFHVLYREGRKLLLNNPRSATVISVAALEFAVKSCIVYLNPKSTWLIESFQSPPVFKIIKEYLPDLTADIYYNGIKINIPERIHIEIQNIVTNRNQIVHRAAPPLEFKSLRNKLIAIKDVLHIIDFYMGNQWALEYISDETEVELGLRK